MTIFYSQRVDKAQLFIASSGQPKGSLVFVHSLLLRDPLPCLLSGHRHGDFFVMGELDLSSDLILSPYLVGENLLLIFGSCSSPDFYLVKTCVD
ncbi:hypothetical protein CEXT_372251 [Caerostris extrusa]|uniref:Uncharacterized protein n=1 Tax=Caerostris extrusa TaxID=172846 RepID=A0AAV4QCU4_CAEEX|nr:hypothetical protein CEXT_372251 [Caerostris extrusa]